MMSAARDPDDLAELQWVPLGNESIKCYFFCLPVELRIVIYELVLYKGAHFDVIDWHKIRIPPLLRSVRAYLLHERAILRTCCQIRDEALSTFYSMNVFRWDCKTPLPRDSCGIWQHVSDMRAIEIILASGPQCDIALDSSPDGFSVSVAASWAKDHVVVLWAGEQHWQQFARELLSESMDNGRPRLTMDVLWPLLDVARDFYELLPD